MLATQGLDRGLRIGYPVLVPTEHREGCGPMSNKMLTVREVADRLNCATSTVYAWIREGKLEHHRAGKLVRVSEDQLDRFLEQSGGIPPPELGTTTQEQAQALNVSPETLKQLIEAVREQVREEMQAPARKG